MALLATTLAMLVRVEASVEGVAMVVGKTKAMVTGLKYTIVCINVLL